jgi:L-alanine-DL-glutamate epimerase-like enolase superfamily enzyme
MIGIVELTARAFDVPMATPFGIATGTQELASNVLCTLQLSDGTRGVGEAAPFPAVSGETQAMVLEALAALGPALVGQDAERCRHVSGLAHEALAHVPSALAAVDVALLDALCRRAGRSMWHHFGGRTERLVTDITIPTGDVAAARAAAESARAGGFCELKIKVGRGDIDLDAKRVRAVHLAAPRCTLILDANAGLTTKDALALLAALGTARARVVLFEQPVGRDDWDGLSQVERDGGVTVAADESARSASEVAALARRGVCRAINVKTAKTGLFGAWDMANVARAHGLELMIGGMVETELAMTASACLAAGMGGFRYIDLDTFFFMGPRPLSGGFRVRGAELDLAALGPGHGVALASD